MKKPNLRKVHKFSPVFALLLILFCACPSKSSREITELLNQYSSSVTKQQAREFRGCFESGYRDAFFEPGAAQEAIGQALAGPYAPSLEFKERKVSAAGGRATVSQEYDLQWLEGGKARSDRGREELELRRTDSGWRIVSGSMVYQILAGRDREVEAISAVLEQRIRALADKDPGRFTELVDPEYHFHDKDFHKVIADLEGNFRDYERIELRLDRPRITLFSGRADVVEGYELKVRYQGNDKEFHDTEKLEFRKTGSGWKISKGL